MDIRCGQKKCIIDEIKKTNNWDMLDKIEEILREKPVYITDFIVELFEKNYGNEGEVYCVNEIMYAFEHDVRKIWLKIKDKLVPESDYIDHWCDLYVEQKCGIRYQNGLTKEQKYTQDLDIWISEQGYIFDTSELTWVIFNIWCGKVTFSK